MQRSPLLTAAGGVLIYYALLPWLGWWLGAPALWPLDLADLTRTWLADAARTLYLALALGLAGAVWWLAARVPGSRPFLLAWISAGHHAALEIILVMGPCCDRREQLVLADSAVLRWAGLALFCGGAALAAWTSALRGAEAARQEQTAPEPLLLVSGPYRRLRYPHHLGLLILALGAALVFRSWLGLGGCLLLAGTLIPRIQHEEQAALKKYGIRWSAYARHSWKLIPYIY